LIESESAHDVTLGATARVISDCISGPTPRSYLLIPRRRRSILVDSEGDCDLNVFQIDGRKRTVPPGRNAREGVKRKTYRQAATQKKVKQKSNNILANHFNYIRGLIIS
jgi:hypothetical protein